MCCCRLFRGRWLSESVEVLCEKYPRLLVAFLDSSGVGGQAANYSVLMSGKHGRSVYGEGEGHMPGQRVEEVYRVRLPVNR